MRWLTVRVPGDPDHKILLERPGPPGMSEENAVQVRDAVTKGTAGCHLFFAVDDAQPGHAELKARGVELTEEPADQSFGIDFVLRVPISDPRRVGLGSRSW